MNQNVTFRRIGGRIVPIKNKAKEVGKGTGMAAAGVAVGIGVGIASAKLDARSHKLFGFSKTAEFHADRLWDSGRGYAAIRRMRYSEDLLKRSVRAGKFGTKVAVSGHAVSAGLIAGGVNKALNQTKLKDKPEVRAAASTAAGVGATFAIKTAYDSHLFKGLNAGNTIRAVIKAAVKKSARLL